MHPSSRNSKDTLFYSELSHNPKSPQKIKNCSELYMPGKKYLNQCNEELLQNFLLVVVNLILVPEITCLPLLLRTTTANYVTSSMHNSNTTTIIFHNRNMVNSLSTTDPCCLVSLQVYAREWNWNCNLIGLLDCQRQPRLQIVSAGSLPGIYNKYSPCLRNTWTNIASSNNMRHAGGKTNKKGQKREGVPC